ncbi:hypothetical protein Ddc_08752 [Ditylenchus destructor]|nr:hypothetical protein Ddc_08752 [Ditylenchus destructor]
MSQMGYFLASVAFMALIWSRLANGCMRTGAGGGVVVTTTPVITTTIPSTTTTAGSECAAKQGEVPIYEDSSFVIASSFYGQVPSSSTCATCSTGQALYYPDSTEVVPRAASAKAIGGLNCANLCLCQADGTCFFLYPFCNGADCAVYAIVVGGSDTDGIVTTDGATTVTAASQVNPTTLDMFPVTQDSLYPRITSVSCNGCNFQMSCNGGPSP